jgi:hypothetical protein
MSQQPEMRIGRLYRRRRRSKQKKYQEARKMKAKRLFEGFDVGAKVVVVKLVVGGGRLIQLSVA